MNQPDGPSTTRCLAQQDTARRVADFHSLRYTFITTLAQSGVHKKVPWPATRSSHLRWIAIRTAAADRKSTRRLRCLN